MTLAFEKLFEERMEKVVNRLVADPPPANEKTSPRHADGTARPPKTSPRVPPETEGQVRESPANRLYVGTKKPVMSYAMSALMQLTQYGEVVIKARGLAISRAVDVAQVITKRFGIGQFKIMSVRLRYQELRVCFPGGQAGSCS